MLTKLQQQATTAASWSSNDLAYCSNLHPGESLRDIRHNLNTHLAAVKQQRGLHSMASGLWLSAKAALELQHPQPRTAFRRDLIETGITLTSLNGFPYGNFHQDKVKADVYLPDWSSPKRLQYTQQLANLLSECMPDSTHEGTISTLPLGYKAHWNAHKNQRALQHLCELESYLQNIYQRTGKRIIVCLEMEPDCVLEYTDELLTFFNHYKKHRQHPNHACLIGVCYDVCHQAVMHESIYDSLARIHAAAIYIGKIQVSNALQVNAHALAQDTSLQDLLQSYAEPTYLHQVKAIDTTGRIQSYADLDQALSAPPDVADTTMQWRVHFHVPLYCKSLQHKNLTTTQYALIDMLDFLSDHAQQGVHPFLEVETYSWQVLPSGLRPTDNASLHQGIVNEIHWLEEQLAARELLIP